MRLAIIRLSPEILAEWLRGDGFPFKTEPTLPEDLKIHTIYRDIAREYPRNAFHVLVESEEFDNLPEGGVIPQLDLIIHKKKCGIEREV